MLCACAYVLVCTKSGAERFRRAHTSQKAAITLRRPAREVGEHVVRARCCDVVHAKVGEVREAGNSFYHVFSISLIRLEHCIVLCSVT